MPLDTKEGGRIYHTSRDRPPTKAWEVGSVSEATEGRKDGSLLIPEVHFIN